MSTTKKLLAVLWATAMLAACGSCVVKSTETGTPPAEDPAGEPAEETAPPSEATPSETITLAEAEKAERGELVGKIVVGEDPCQSDADCVPGGCCHPRTCVAQANAPSCDDAKCTLICLAGTLDCGGHCLCRDGKCAAQLSGPFVRTEPKPE